MFKCPKLIGWVSLPYNFAFTPIWNDASGNSISNWEITCVCVALFWAIKSAFKCLKSNMVHRSSEIHLYINCDKSIGDTWDLFKEMCYLCLNFSTGIHHWISKNTIYLWRVILNGTAIKYHTWNKLCTSSFVFYPLNHLRLSVNKLNAWKMHF